MSPAGLSLARGALQLFLQTCLLCTAPGVCSVGRLLMPRSPPARGRPRAGLRMVHFCSLGLSLSVYRSRPCSVLSSWLSRICPDKTWVQFLVSLLQHPGFLWWPHLLLSLTGGLGEDFSRSLNSAACTWALCGLRAPPPLVAAQLDEEA